MTAAESTTEPQPPGIPDLETADAHPLPPHPTLTPDTAADIAGWEWFELTPRWSQRDERLEPFVGQELREVALLEWWPAGRDLAAGTVAVEFAFAGGCLRIVNGLDENRIEVGGAQPDYIRHRLGR